MTATTPGMLRSVQHPQDEKYRWARKKVISDLMKMSAKDVGEMLGYMASNPEYNDEGGLTSKIIGEIYNHPFAPENVKGILDSGGTSTGNVLIRQDLEPLIYRLFVDEFPLWERIPKLPSNGLVHTSTQITTPSTGTRGSSFMGELGTVTYETGSYNRATWPIAVLGNGRGVSIKEIAAVAAGGAPYNPRELEEQNAMAKLAADAQWAMCQGNATNAAGTSTNEEGTYNALAYDGFRGVTGSTGAFSANGATQIDMGALNILESLQSGANTIAQNGGRPSLVVCSILSKGLLDTEQQNNKIYMEQTTEIIPGLTTNQIQYAYGRLALAPVPGDSIGQYDRTSDSKLVEDFYILDERGIKIRWLYSEGFTVLQIPSGVDGVLSDRIIIFGLYGLQQAMPVFTGKVRRVV